MDFAALRRLIFNMLTVIPTHVKVNLINYTVAPRPYL